MVNKKVHVATVPFRGPGTSKRKLAAVNAIMSDRRGNVVRRSHLRPRDSIHQYAGRAKMKLASPIPQLSHTGSREME